MSFLCLLATMCTRTGRCRALVDKIPANDSKRLKSSQIDGNKKPLGNPNGSLLNSKEFWGNGVYLCLSSTYHVFYICQCIFFIVAITDKNVKTPGISSRGLHTNK